MRLYDFVSYGESQPDSLRPRREKGIKQLVAYFFWNAMTVVATFDPLGGTTLEQSKRVVAVLNESVLDVFVTVKQTGGASSS